MSKDVEMHREMERRAGGNANKRKPDPPALYEYTWEHEALGAIFLQLQQISYLLANQNVRKSKRKKFKPVHWPTPISAADLARRHDRKVAFQHLEEVVRFEDTETWKRRHELEEG